MFLQSLVKTRRLVQRSCLRTALLEECFEWQLKIRAYWEKRFYSYPIVGEVDDVELGDDDVLGDVLGPLLEAWCCDGESYEL